MYSMISAGSGPFTGGRPRAAWLALRAVASHCLSSGLARARLCRATRPGPGLGELPPGRPNSP
eukprot:5712734-Heterocapsa_arctica.AAC.1